MIIHTDFEQHSTLWMTARAGVVTASEFDSLLTPKFKPKEGKGVETYLARKLAERWIGPLPGFMSVDMDLGVILEDEAKPYYTLTTGEEIQNVAFITDNSGKVGCSPDGLIGADGGIEIKCPEPTNHVKYLLAGTLPDDYAAQVHGSMYVTGRKWWKFMSYRRNFPPLIITIERNEEIMETIHFAVAAFVADLDAAFDRMVELNGGPPPKRIALVPEAPRNTASEMPS
ncbi:MAG: lambda exonuclease family protein [Solirubrobacterales bacterium]